MKSLMILFSCVILINAHEDDSGLVKHVAFHMKSICEEPKLMAERRLTEMNKLIDSDISEIKKIDKTHWTKGPLHPKHLPKTKKILTERIKVAGNRLSVLAKVAAHKCAAKAEDEVKKCLKNMHINIKIRIALAPVTSALHRITIRTINRLKEQIIEQMKGKPNFDFDAESRKELILEQKETRKALEDTVDAIRNEIEDLAHGLSLDKKAELKKTEKAKLRRAFKCNPSTLSTRVSEHAEKKMEALRKLLKA